MDKIRIGIPRALHYYYNEVLWKSFFEELGCEVLISPPTNPEIMEMGSKVALDEMCLSLKIYLGHVSYLEGNCDYIFIPRIDNYGSSEQTCTNFLALYDIVHNLFSNKILDCNIDIMGGISELKAFIEVGKKLGKGREQTKIAYYHALTMSKKSLKRRKIITSNLFNSTKIKLLLLSHPYNTYDAMVGKRILEFLKPLSVEVIDGYLIEKDKEYIDKMCPTLYWKYNKEIIGSLGNALECVDGILFLSSFPCGPDSLVNELLIRKIKKPYLNVIIDDVNSLTGIETRLESFVDILEQRKQKI